MSTVLGLHELGRDDIARAGGKGANLGELIKAGFDVPDGFVLTTEAYAARSRLLSCHCPHRTRTIPPRSVSRCAESRSLRPLVGRSQPPTRTSALVRSLCDPAQPLRTCPARPSLASRTASSM